MMERGEKKNPMYTQEEYLELERKAPYKNEYYNGEIFAMSGASRNHNVITINFLSFLSYRLKGKGCRPYSNDLRIHIPVNTLYTYPDVIVVCGKEEYLDNQFDTLLNPTFIAEILSPSTEDYDVGRKFGFYRSITSLKEYWTISSYDYRLQRYVKNEKDNTWLLSEATQITDTVSLSCLDLTISMEEIYEGVSF